jgi:hypothetical protein
MDEGAVVRYQLNHPLYNTPLKIRGHSRKIRGRDSDSRAAARVIACLTSICATEHADIAAYHRKRALRLNAIWSLVVKKAAIEAFGRPYRFQDYKISGIASDDFAEHHKRVLRHCSHRANEHDDVASAHELLSRRCK